MHGILPLSEHGYGTRWFLVLTVLAQATSPSVCCGRAVSQCNTWDVDALNCLPY